MKNDYILITESNKRKWKEYYLEVPALRTDLKKKVASAKMEAIQLQVSLFKEAGRGFVSYIQRNAILWKTDEDKWILETVKQQTEK